MMQKPLKYILAILVLSASAFTFKAEAQELIYPDPSLTPQQVVSIQLDALGSVKREDTSGFLQTWIFAHPQNKAVTGPLQRFALMLQNPTFAVLIGHKDHEIDDVFQKDDKAFLFVNIFDESKKLIALFRWELSLAQLEDSSQVWMTTNVTRLLQPDDVT